MTSGESIILEIFSSKIRFAYLDTVVLWTALLLLLILFFRCYFDTLDVDQHKCCVAFHSILVIFLISTTKLTICLSNLIKSEPQNLYSEEIAHFYILPYSWLISCYICNSYPVKKWIQNQEERIENPEIPMESIGSTVVPPPERRDSVETTVSYLQYDTVSIQDVVVA
ncbi:hypothetical protein B9Z55_003415 [Caenorhabditis nigoni]|uniref:Uncharacterized protein n=1 Tax=Caenorhabditis nigoni TaxID=1611254 RepID=A0A2G5VQ78_9PELO|nr:hypothetical protein B9Z55_003415 [Caenorhabditis nigoni]